MQLDSGHLAAMPQRQRAALINSLSGYKSANLVGTRSAAGQTNLAIVSSVFHLGSDPALMGFISRPPSVERHTLNNIEATGFYTLNHIHAGMIEPAHQTSARYPESVSEFEATGLTPAAGDICQAPFVRESRIRLGMALRDMKAIELNNTVLVIGEIIEVHLPEGAIGEDGFVDIEAHGTVAISGLDSYHHGQRLCRLSYAKPDQPLRKLD